MTPGCEPLRKTAAALRWPTVTPVPNGPAFQSSLLQAGLPGLNLLMTVLIVGKKALKAGPQRLSETFFQLKVCSFLVGNKG